MDFDLDLIDSLQAAQRDMKDIPNLSSDPDLLNEISDFYFRYQRKVSDPRPMLEVLKQADRLLSDGFSTEAVSDLAMYIPYFEDENQLFSVYMANGNTKAPSYCLDAWVKRQAKRKRSCVEDEEDALLLETYDDMAVKRRMETRKEKKAKNPLYKRKRSYKDTLERIYDYFMDDEMLPANTAMAFSYFPLIPAYFNQMFRCLRQIFGVVDAGYHDLHAFTGHENSISKSTWLQAIELALALDDLYDFQISEMADPREDKAVAELVELRYPTIIALGLLIHNLHLFSAQKYSEMLYQERNQKGVSQEEISLQAQVQELTKKLSAANKEVESLRKDNRALRQQLQSKGNNTDVNQLIHEHNAQLKSKDEKIEELQDLTERLEDEVSTLASRVHMALYHNETADRAWTSISLPENRVLFAGGNRNLTNKLKQLHPDWVFANTENAPLPTDVDVIFVMSNHVLSHGTWYRLNRFYQGRDLMRYVQATNLEKLELEMRYEYWSLCEERKKAKVK